MARSPRLLACALALLAVPAGAQTIAVTTTSDAVDFGGARTADDLPGPDGQVTLPEAVIAATNTAGPQTIAFAIPLSDPGYKPQLGIFDLALDDFDPTLRLTDDGTVVDGLTQTAHTGDTNPHGPEVVLRNSPVNASQSAFVVTGDGNVIRGLGGFLYFAWAVDLRGDENRVEACVMTAPVGGIRVEGDRNVIGGESAALGNRVSSSTTGVLIAGEGSTGNVALNNRIYGNSSVGMAVEGAGNRIGAAGAGNVFVQNGRTTSGQYASGSHLEVSGPGNVVQGNLIGLESDGVTNAAFPAARGLLATGAATVVGGPGAGEGNVFGGFAFYRWVADRRRALVVTGAGSVVQGNLIGVGADGTTPIVSRTAAVLGSDVLFGGLGPGEGNVVAHTQEAAVAVNPGATGAAILGNRIYASGAGYYIDAPPSPAIDLADDGFTPNDPSDPDEGANRFQNSPALNNITRSGDVLTVAYTVDTAPANATYDDGEGAAGLIVEFFLADARGQGRLFLGRDRFTAADHAAGGKTTAVPVAGVELGPDPHVVATATDEAGNTSEYSSVAAVRTTVDAGPDAGADALALAVAPSPASGRAAVHLTLPTPGPVTVAVYDALGRQIATLHDGPMAAGAHSLTFEAAALPAGVYVVRATGPSFALTTRAVVAR